MLQNTHFQNGTKRNLQNKEVNKSFKHCLKTFYFPTTGKCHLKIVLSPTALACHFFVSPLQLALLVGLSQSTSAKPGPQLSTSHSPPQALRAMLHPECALLHGWWAGSLLELECSFLSAEVAGAANWKSTVGYVSSLALGDYCSFSLRYFPKHFNSSNSKDNFTVRTSSTLMVRAYHPYPLQKVRKWIAVKWISTHKKNLTSSFFCSSENRIKSSITISFHLVLIIAKIFDFVT